MWMFFELKFYNLKSHNNYNRKVTSYSFLKNEV